RAASLGSNEAALKFYNELYRKNPGDPRIAMGRAVTLQKLGETQKAIDGYRDVLNTEPDNPEALTNLMGLIGKTQPAVAIQNLLDLKERFPRSADVSAQLGLAYAQSGNPQDGLKQLNAAANLQPENPLHYFNMAVIYDRLKDRENAIKYYEQALDVYSVNGGAGNFSREQIYDRLATLRGS
ncbi:MAG: occlusion derived virus envelope protein 66, partial [Micavibrio aeruginosavorus]